ncbi:MAG: porphobilinogen synthase [Ignavibacteriae bacterium]|nr:porphobilinogen synthase [Ignavibacteriota bacterium]
MQNEKMPNGFSELTATESFKRLRRLRMTDAFRAMVRETELSTKDFIYPLFVVPGSGIRREVGSMPGVYQLSVDEVLRESVDVKTLGIPAVILFGIPEHKDEMGSEAYSEHGIVQTAVRAMKKEVPELVVITDVCLCEYTSHGHCGIIRDNEIVNDESIELLTKEALTHAQAGADMVAPSDMFDGRVQAIRRVLDQHGFPNLPIMSYAAKYASGFYGPFREAAQSTPQFGDRRSHQMDPANSEEAIREVQQDILEGADIVMVKPALSYLDVIRRVKDQFGMPTAAYNVSGEYSMIKAAGRNGWIDEQRVMMEVLTSIKRAGADLILTYFAKDAAKLLRDT